jgi:type I restriction enzyme S subunit
LIRTFKVPVPPLAEQHRIVAKVDELMRLCEELEQKLADTQTERSLLLESILYHALDDCDGSVATTLFDTAGTVSAAIS